MRNGGNCYEEPLANPCVRGKIAIKCVYILLSVEREEKLLIPCRLLMKICVGGGGGVGSMYSWPVYILYH